MEVLDHNTTILCNDRNTRINGGIRITTIFFRVNSRDGHMQSCMYQKNLHKPITSVLSTFFYSSIPRTLQHKEGTGVKSLFFPIAPHHLHTPPPSLQISKFLDLLLINGCNTKLALQKRYSNAKKECTQVLHFFTNLYLNLLKT